MTEIDYRFDEDGVLHIELPEDYEHGHIYVDGDAWARSDR